MAARECKEGLLDSFGLSHKETVFQQHELAVSSQVSECCVLTF